MISIPPRNINPRENRLLEPFLSTYNVIAELRLAFLQKIQASLSNETHYLISNNSWITAKGE